MNFPCPIPGVNCPGDGGNPFINTSSEAPDPFMFLGEAFDNGTGVNALPPLGYQVGSLTAYTTCDSTVSQAAADACAATSSQIGSGGTWIAPPQQPNPNPPVNKFPNTAQTATTRCPDGTPYTFTTPAGMFTASTQVEANTDALEYAQQQAQHHLLCFSTLPSPICANTGADLAIFASSAFIEPGPNIWQFISGALPPGMSFNPTNGAQAFITGTPTTPGNYSFVIEIILANGDSQSKTFHLTVAGINNLGSIPSGAPLEPYNFTFTTVGYGLAEFFVTGGNLPDGLSMDIDGNITGTPATDAQTSTFNVTIEDFNTGLVCDQSATIKVGPPFNWTPTTWGRGGAGGDVFVPSTPIGAVFNIVANGGSQPYEFAQGFIAKVANAGCNLELQISNFADSGGYWAGHFSVVIYSGGAGPVNTILDVEAVNAAPTGTQVGPRNGTYNFPFTLPNDGQPNIFVIVNVDTSGNNVVSYRANITGTLTPHT